MTPREALLFVIVGAIVFGIAFAAGRRSALGRHHAREQKSGDREV